jgi:hypothetical protein
MPVAICTLCQTEIEGAPHYSTTGELVCSECYQQSVAKDRVETQPGSVASQPTLPASEEREIGFLTSIILVLVCAGIVALGGMSFTRGREPSASPPTRQQLSAACAKQDRHACAALGQSFSDQSNYAAALAPLQTACSLRLSSACALLATHYDDGHYSDPRQDKAFEYFGRACKLGVSDACDSARRVLLERKADEHLRP